MRMKAFRRFTKSARSKKKAAHFSRATAAAAVFATAAVFVGAAMLMSARASSTPVLPKSDAKLAKAGPLDTPADPGFVDAPAAGRVSGAITIVGCLERDDERFRLKDTEGDDAPKARSWKSGFLRKRSAAIHVVDSSNRLKLPSHVGHRVSITGTLIDRDMQAQTLKQVAASCGN